MTPRNALLAIHLGALMFGLSGVLGKLAESSALIITFGRALFAVLALLLVAQLLRPSGATPNWRQRGGLALGGLLLGAHWLTFFIAVKIAGVGIATLGFASFPAFTVLLEGLLFRERTRAIEFTMVGLVCAGLLLVAPAFDLSSGPTAGLLYGVLSGLLFALLSLLNRAVTRGLDPVRSALWQNLAILAALLPFCWSAIPAIPAQDWLWLARTTSVIFALEPVYGIAFAWWLFGEQPTLRMLLGGALIIIASVVTSRLKSPPSVAPKLAS